MTVGGSVESGLRAVLTGIGATPLEAVDRHLRLEPQAPPVPGPGDVVIAVRSAAVGWVDLLMAAGQYQHAPPLPYTPGLELAGDVLSVGAGVRAVGVGDRVVVDGLLAGPRSTGAYQQQGGFASFVLAPEAAARPIPAAFGYDQAASFFGSYETAWHALVACADLRAGETVLVHGASGATGLAAVHLAKALGATVIATGRSPAKLQIVAEQGADHVIAGPFRDRVKALTDGRGVDVVYDGVGGAVSLETLRCVAFGARFVVVGWASTPFAAGGSGRPSDVPPNHLPTNLILLKGLRVIGSPMAIATHRDPAIRAPRVAALLALVEAGRLVPYVGAAFPLTEVARALRARWHHEVVGGCVVNP